MKGFDKGNLIGLQKRELSKRSPRSNGVRLCPTEQYELFNRKNLIVSIQRMTCSSHFEEEALFFFSE